MIFFNRKQKPEISSFFPFLLLLFLLVSACGGGRGNRFEDWDADKDVAITEDEFGTIFRDAGYFSVWDVNNDGLIDKTEWEAGMSAHYPEYNPAVSGYYDAWMGLADEDMLDEEEFTARTYRLWDTNKDGIIDSAEYEVWYREK